MFYEMHACQAANTEHRILYLTHAYILYRQSVSYISFMQTASASLRYAGFFDGDSFFYYIYILLQSFL